MTVVLDCILGAGGSIIDLDVTFFIVVGIFFLTMLVLSTMLFKPIFAVLDARRLATEGAAEESKTLGKDAEAKRKEYEKRVLDIKHGATEDREAMRIAARKTENEILEAGRVDCEKILGDARVGTERHVKEARVKLDAEAETIATMLVDRVLGAAKGGRT